MMKVDPSASCFPLSVSHSRLSSQELQSANNGLNTCIISSILTYILLVHVY